MIKIENVFKSFNRGRNKVKAIEGTSLEFDNKGLVALLGPSGCGKTTLLNVIGGLDKVRKGSIKINDELMSSKIVSKVDRIRNNHISYIFQDYKLVNNMTVYQNVEIVLKMIGLKDKKEIEDRVLFALERVDMIRYKKRPCSMLSGGERQRVAIARAIVKDPDIILADEPTGNLDSKNSLEIMKIISAIAKDKLVILVTHEESLAQFYATRIIKIKDGVVIDDYENKDIKDLEYVIENRIYLKDFKNISNIKKDNYTFNVYQDDKEKINLNIVVKNGNIYIESPSRLEVIDEHTNIELVNDHYKKTSKSDIDKYDFNLDSVIKTKEKKYTSIFRFLNFITGGFKKVFGYSFLKKILLLGFFGSAMFTLFAVGVFNRGFTVDDSSFLDINRNYLVADTGRLSIDNLKVYEEAPGVLYLVPNKSKYNFSLLNTKYDQFKYDIYLNTSIAASDYLNEDDLIYGKLPSNGYEVVIDSYYANELLEDIDMINQGIFNYEDMIGLKLSNDYDKDISVVGVINGIDKSIYVMKDYLYSYMYHFNGEYYVDSMISYSLFSDSVEITKGSAPIGLNEVMMKEEYSYGYKVGSKYIINDVEYVISGFYSSDDIFYNLVSDDFIKNKLFNNYSSIAIMSDDKDSTLAYYESMDINAMDSYEFSKNNYEIAVSSETSIIYMISVVVLVISLVEIFFMVRASFMSRVKEVGIYRAIGVKRLDIFKMFMGEIFAISILASLPGILIMYYILSSIEVLEMISLVSPLMLFITIVLVFGFNLIIGLFPVFSTIRKRPAYILSRNDVE